MLHVTLLEAPPLLHLWLILLAAHMTSLEVAVACLQQKVYHPAQEDPRAAGCAFLVFLQEGTMTKA